MDCLFAPASPLLFGDDDMLSYEPMMGSGAGMPMSSGTSQQSLGGLGSAGDSYLGFGDPTYDRLLPSMHGQDSVDSRNDEDDFFAAGKRKGYNSGPNQADSAASSSGLASSSNKLARLDAFDDDDDIVVTSGSANAIVHFPSYAISTGQAKSASAPLGWPVHAAPMRAEQHQGAGYLVPVQHPHSTSNTRVTRSATAPLVLTSASRALSTISEESEGRSSSAVDNAMGRSSPAGSPAVHGSAPGPATHPKGMARYTSSGGILASTSTGSTDSDRSAHGLNHVEEDEEEIEEGDLEEEEELDEGGPTCASSEGDEVALPHADDEAFLVVLPKSIALTLGKKGRLPLSSIYPRGRLVTACAYSVGVYGVQNGQRGGRLEAFRGLRSRRIFYKKVKYTQRHSLANGRQRIKGRFVKDDTPGAAPPKTPKSR